LENTTLLSITICGNLRRWSDVYQTLDSDRQASTLLEIEHSDNDFKPMLLHPALLFGSLTVNWLCSMAVT
jgi:hypothetical protein